MTSTAADRVHATAGRSDRAHRADRTGTDTARRLYEAECALHCAHQTGVDAWIAAASDRLHEAVCAHLRAPAA
jgi:hypothetical protein